MTRREAAYVFRVTLRLDPPSGLRADPDRFETTVERAATPPGEDDDWLFFRDHCWRGEAADEAHLRRLLAETLGVRPAEASAFAVESVAFRELRTDRAYLDALGDAIAAELDAGVGTFGNADTVEDVLTRYLGSSIHVRPPDG